MTSESARLRELIRTTLDCHCPPEQRGWSTINHNPGCRWQAAVQRIYELERDVEK